MKFVKEFKYLSGYKLEIAKEKQYRLLDTCYYLSMMWYDKIDDLKQQCGKIDTTVVIGWKVTHKFRCKSKDGTPNIVDKIFVFDRDIKNVLYKNITSYSEIQKRLSKDAVCIEFFV